MTPDSALSVLSQLAVTIMGFTGVITAFESKALTSWSKVDRIRLGFLLGSSAWPMVLALLGMVLLTVDLDGEIFSVIFSATVFIVLGWWCIRGSRKVSAVPRQELLSAGWSPKLFWALQSVIIVLLICQIVNILFFRTFWPIFGLLAAQMGAAVMQFIRVIVTRGFKD